MITERTEQLKRLFKTRFGTEVSKVTPLPQGGSDRLYYRLTDGTQSAIGAFNPDVDENRAYFYLTEHFFGKGFPVAQLLGIAPDEKHYLVSDLGDCTLMLRFGCTLWEKGKDTAMKRTLKQSLALLAQFQIEGAKDLDFNRCYPKSTFDRQSVMWDFNYFKYSFLKPSGIRFNEAKLDDDFMAFADVLLAQPCSYFHYRDFQSRNIMLVNDSPYLIDYQGGRKGPLLYDIASFLYQAKANFPQWLRDEMLEFYLEKVKELEPVNIHELKKQFPNFALFRVIQTLGAYGYRGFFERRAHFLESIPLAAGNLPHLLEAATVSIPSLLPILMEINEKYGTKPQQNDSFEGLTVEITSFSFKKGYPMEHAEHGGGYIFDCRALPNPGRLFEFKDMNGFDTPVIDYFAKHPEVEKYLDTIKITINQSVEAYLKRGFCYLSIAFGCTGGQHRSVYMANRLAQWAEQLDGVRVKLFHRELNIRI